MIVAIDGPAGSGKSTIAREVAQRFGFEKLDTGALYRTVAWACLARGIDAEDLPAVAAVARETRIRFDGHGEQTSIWADGSDVSEAIRTPEVERIVSAVAANPEVRSALLPVQRAFATGRDVVAEGRDIGTVVFPHAELKIFLTADPAERARRRVLQRHEHDAAAPAEPEIEREVAATLTAIERRDALDSTRDVAPLTAAPDAIKLDSTSFTIDEIVARVGALIEERR